MNTSLIKEPVVKRLAETYQQLYIAPGEDAVGIYAAFDRFDPKMEELFLGIKDGRYEGGRLENYIEAETDKEKQGELNRLAEKISKVLESFSGIITGNGPLTPFELVPLLEDKKEILWDL